MSAFEFFFTLYGLVLGLSVVEVVAGISRLVHDSKGVRIGVLTPLLALVLLTDLCGFWLAAYRFFSDRPLDYVVIVLSLGAASLYYIAASVVFPRDLSREPDLDAVYMRHRRLVMIGIAVAGLVMFEAIPAMTAAGRAERLAFWLDLSQSWQPLVFFACVAAISLTRNKPSNIGLLLLMMAVNVLSFLRWAAL
jgi:hypothetical protein